MKISSLLFLLVFGSNLVIAQYLPAGQAGCDPDKIKTAPGTWLTRAGGYISGKIQGGTIEKVGVKVERNVSAGAGAYSVESSTTFHDSSISFAPGF